MGQGVGQSVEGVGTCVCGVCVCAPLVWHDEREAKPPLGVFYVLQSAETSIIDNHCGLILRERREGREGSGRKRRGRGRERQREGRGGGREGQREGMGLFSE